MAKRKRTRKQYDSSLTKQKFDKNDKLLGRLKIVFLFLIVIVVGVVVISKINS